MFVYFINYNSVPLVSIFVYIIYMCYNSFNIFLLYFEGPLLFNELTSLYTYTPYLGMSTYCTMCYDCSVEWLCRDGSCICFNSVFH